MPVPGDHQVSPAGNRAFQDTVVRLVVGDGMHRYRGGDDLSDLGDQLEIPDDLVFLPLKPAEDFAISRMMAGEASKTNRPLTA